ncbi:MAG TPA: DNA-directed RNA polymerase subunit delta [Bacillus sp. (in: firmicutes)]|uniref:DNA-directed RNA polymerase subunit delta n=1 Tax=Bacillus litorisediminis TaxID=2922713 RepID=UPI0028BEAD57|nr:DNA-directed RNA polymerase subunit delta [Bacillus litorisediminis]HWO74422.1 DNA-directed RNA polymerase subunit delta [Bacillus sp. (in: firmicutes)]
MSILQTYAKEDLQEMSLIELAYLLLADKKEPLPFNDLVSEIASILELSEEQVQDRMPQFYTDMNIDGRFLCIGENKWGLRTWYPLDQIEEETVPTIRPKKKKGKKLMDDDDLDIDEFDDIDEEDLDFDDLDEEYEDDEILDEDEDEDEDDDDFDDLGDDEEDFDDEDIIEDDDYDLDGDDIIDDDIEPEDDDDL